MLSKDFSMISWKDTIARRTTFVMTVILSLGLALILISLISGCGTNAPTKAAQAEQVVITTVNDGVRVIVREINAGHLTQKQCDTFSAAYTDYYNAQQILKAVIEKANATSPTATPADIARAQTSVTEAETALLAFINSVIPK